jgi:hypothetical protein
VLMESSPLVDGNRVSGGCAVEATGIHAIRSSARVQNNDVFGFSSVDCNVATHPRRMQNKEFAALLVVGGPGAELDVHSNRFTFAEGYSPPNLTEPDGSCRMAGVRVEATSGLTTPTGIFRNNLIPSGAGGCTSVNTVFATFFETTADADPRIFENNVLSTYMNEGSSRVGFAQANAFTDITVSGNIGVLCTLPLTAGSPCIGAGTTVGAPRWDMDDQPRDAAPDIGPDEYVAP